MKIYDKCIQACQHRVLEWTRKFKTRVVKQKLTRKFFIK